MNTLIFKDTWSSSVSYKPSCVWLFATLWTVTYQDPYPWISLGKNTGVGSHFLLQGTFTVQGLNLISCIAERFFTMWATREFPSAHTYKGSCEVISDSLWTCGLYVPHQAPPSMRFSRQEYRRALPFPSPGHLPIPGIKPASCALQVSFLLLESLGKPIWSIILQ